MRPLLLIQTGEAPESIRVRYGGFADWFRDALRLPDAGLQVVQVDRGEGLPAPDAVAGAVITGSAAMVTERAGWSERTAAWIRSAMADSLPLFGVCYGHQLMAHALGGEVGWLPGGREIGTRTVRRDPRTAIPLSDGVPESFAAQTTHRQAVLQPPPGATVLAHSARDPYQVLGYGPRALSTQFHPEFQVAHMRAYIAARADAMREEGLDPDALAAAVVDTPVARDVLARFGQAALARANPAATA